MVFPYALGAETVYPWVDKLGPTRLLCPQVATSTIDTVSLLQSPCDITESGHLLTFDPSNFSDDPFREAVDINNSTSISLPGRLGTLEEQPSSRNTENKPEPLNIPLENARPLQMPVAKEEISAPVVLCQEDISSADAPCQCGRSSGHHQLRETAQMLLGRTPTSTRPSNLTDLETSTTESAASFTSKLTTSTSYKGSKAVFHSALSRSSKAGVLRKTLRKQISILRHASWKVAQDINVLRKEALIDADRLRREIKRSTTRTRQAFIRCEDRAREIHHTLKELEGKGDE